MSSQKEKRWRRFCGNNSFRHTEWRALLTKHYQAVEEDLCFGWIDSIVKRMDNEKLAQKYTPLRDCTKWSALNKRRPRKVNREGKMTEAGLAKIDIAMLGEEATEPAVAVER